MHSLASLSLFAVGLICTLHAVAAAGSAGCSTWNALQQWLISPTAVFYAHGRPEGRGDGAGVGPIAAACETKHPITSL